MAIERTVDTRAVYAAAGLVSGGGALFFNVMPVFVGSLADAFAVDASELGDLVAAFNVGFTVAAISALAWMRRVPWRVTSAVASGLAVAALIAMSLATDYMAVGGLAGALGIAMGSLYALVMDVLGQSSHPDRAFGIKLGLETLPGAILLFALPVIVQPRWGFDGVVLAMAATIATLGLATVGLPARGRRRERKTDATDGSRSQRWPAATALFSSLCFFTGIAASWAFLELLAHAKSLPTGLVGTVLSVGFVLSGIGGFAAALVNGRYGRLAPMIAIILVNWIALLLLATPGSAAYALGACAFLFTVNFALAYTFGLTAEIDARGTFVVLSAAALSIGAIVGPATGGRLVEMGGYPALLMFSAACSLASLLSYAFVVRRAPVLVTSHARSIGI